MTEKVVRSLDWISRIARDRTFVDIGGLWKTKNEKVTHALRAGATAATMVDIAPQGHKLWSDFHAHCKASGIENYKSLSADVTDPRLKEKLGIFDVVHCSGVIYHVPDLIYFVRNLMSISSKYVIITSMIVPERIENQHGVVDLSNGYCMFVPTIGPVQRAVLAEHFDSTSRSIPHINGKPVEEWFSRGTWKFGPWSWLITPAFLRQLVVVCGMRLLDSGSDRTGRAYHVLCEIV